MIGYVDCFSGVSGDMLLGALVDAGLELPQLQAAVARLGVQGYRILIEPRQDGALSGAQLRVELEDSPQPERHLSDILGLLERSELEPTVVERSSAVFRRLARAEGAVHGIAPEQVHFHEVGALDALVDVVGVVAGLELLGVSRLYASALPLGGGQVTSRHGVLPLPAPATLEILAEARAPTRPLHSDRELVTPTGAALLAELATFEQPAMRLVRVGYGFGRRQLAWPNCLRLWLGESLATIASEQVAVLEANLDDCTPETLGYVLERLFEAGALDVYFQPLQMKKNRPGILLGVVARPTQAAELAELVLRETTTLGVRESRLERYVANRYSATIVTRFGPLAVKIKQLGDRRVVSPEYEAAAQAARDHGVPLADVYREAYRTELPEPPPGG
jgi:uncharacterized protein (TIGR00299 family) protein